MNSPGLILTLPDGSLENLYTPTPKQIEYHSRIEPNVLFWGGRGSGKSMCGRFDAHMRALSHPGFKYCILRRTYPELQKSHLTSIGAEMRKLGGRYNHTDRMAHYPNGSMGFFSHCQSDEDVLNLLSAEFHLMFFDEVSTFEWEMFTKLAASVRVPVNSGLTAMVRAATNPLGVSSEEIQRYFVLKDINTDEDPDYNPNDWYNVHANLEDNPHIDQDQYRKRFAGLPAHVRRAWVDGEFGLENALFDFQPKKNGEPYHVTNYLDLENVLKSAQIYRAFDMGFFPDPAYCVWIAHLGNRYIAFHEQLWFRTIASDIAEDMKSIDEELGIKRVLTTYCDPTLEIHTGVDIRSMRDVFEQHGVPMDPSINNRELYASHIHTALAEEASEGVPRLQIYVSANGKMGCPYLAKTLPQQRYDPKKPLALANHKDDHGAVSIAYFLISSGSMERRSIRLGTGLRPWQREKKGTRLVLGNEGVRDHR